MFQSRRQKIMNIYLKLNLGFCPKYICTGLNAYTHHYTSMFQIVRFA